MVTLAKIAGRLIEEALRWVALLLRSSESVHVESLFLRRQLALFMERGVGAWRVDAATRVSLAMLAKPLEWRGALVVVQLAIMMRWHRTRRRLLWRLRSRPDRPSIPEELCTLMRRMAREVLHRTARRSALVFSKASNPRLRPCRGADRTL